MSRRVTSNRSRRKGRNQPVLTNPAAWPEPVRRGLSVMTGCVVLGGFVWWSAASGHLDRVSDAIGTGLIQVAAHAGFRVDDVLLVGRQQTSRETIMAVLNVQRGDPIFAFDPVAARDMLEKLSWVETVRVERHLPNKISIYITERTPVAFWQQGGQLQVIDRHGRVLETENLKKFGDLPVLVGSRAPAETARILEMLSFEPVIAGRVAAATLVGDRRWDLTLDNKIKIRLPEKDPARALHHLSGLHQQHQILDRDILAIDMRIPEKMVVEASNPAVAEALNLQTGI